MNWIIYHPLVPFGLLIHLILGVGFIANILCMDVYTFRVHDGVSRRNEEKTYHLTHFFAYSVYLNFL